MTEPRAKADKGDILVVDDNPTNLTLLSSMLTEGGYEVRAALSGSLALRAAAATPPDLVLLDINMPGLNGFDVCRELKAQEGTREVPIIFISALDAIGDKVMAFEAGGADYITKPFQMREVLARVRTQLTLARQRRELQEMRRELEERYEQIQELRGALLGHVSDGSSQPSGGGGERTAARRTLTILTSEIHGFVRIAEEAAPDRLLADLDMYATTLTRIVGEHGGEVERLLGDGMLAFFESPVRALRAACHLQKSLAELNGRRAASGSPAFVTRIGLTTGQALLARSGAGGRRSITLVGDPVCLAPRLLADARPGGILLDHATFEAAGRPEDTRHIVMRVRGKTDLIKAHEIVPDAALRLYDALGARETAS